MHLNTVKALSKREAADLFVLPYFQEKESLQLALSNGGALEAFGELPIKAGDFKGKEGETLVVYMHKQPEKRLMLLGLGEAEKISVERLRRAYSKAVEACQRLKVKAINVVIPQVKSLSSEEIVRGLSEGIFLTNYSFDALKHKSKKESPSVLLTHVTLVHGEADDLEVSKKALTLSQAVHFARDLVNGNADDVTPEHLGEQAKELAKKHKTIKAQVFGKSWIEEQGMGLLLAVSRGSSVDPAFIVATYSGAPKSKDHTIVVGKGVTYDTGGLNLKPTGSMETMKADMGGAGTALGTLKAVAELKLPLNLTIVIPSTENSISGKSYKPGDVYKSFEGKTVEIGNTDAEGRLILADALSYASKELKPSRIIDFATLTGAMDIALGNETIGLMSNNQKLADALMQAGFDTFERACQLPLYEEYKDQLKSDVADISNIGGRSAGSITAALFLEEFVGKNIPWAHFDIAGTAFLKKERRYNPKQATGVGVRLMISFLEGLLRKDHA